MEEKEKEKEIDNLNLIESNSFENLSDEQKINVLANQNILNSSGNYYSGQDKRRYKRMLKRKLLNNVK